MGIFNRWPYTNFHEMNLDWIIEEVKKVVTEVEALDLSFDELKKYVEDYFKNLDISKEVNDKIDEMAASGELAQLILEALQLKSIISFDNLASLKNADNLVNGGNIRMMGKEFYNDGYGAYYHIRELRVTDIIDDDLIVSLTNYPSLIAEKLPDNILIDTINSLEDKYIQMSNFTSVANANKYYYVDAVNGDDSNNGESAQTPFKTIDRAFELFKTGRTDLRIYLAGGSTYTTTNFIFTNVALHLLAYGAGDVTLEFPSGDCGFYSCHVNIQGTDNQRFIIRGSTTWYTDGGAHLFIHVDFKCQVIYFGDQIRATDTTYVFLNCQGGNYIFRSTTFGYLLAYSSNIYFSNCGTSIPLRNETTLATTGFGMVFEACLIEMVDNFNVDISVPVTTGSQGTYLSLNGSQLHDRATIIVTGSYKYTIGIYVNCSAAHITTGRLAQFGNIGTTASQTGNAGQIIN